MKNEKDGFSKVFPLVRQFDSVGFLRSLNLPVQMRTSWFVGVELDMQFHQFSLDAFCNVTRRKTWLGSSRNAKRVLKKYPETGIQLYRGVVKIMVPGGRENYFF